MFRLHEDAKGSDMRVLDVFTYDIAATLNFMGKTSPVALAVSARGMLR